MRYLQSDEFKEVVGGAFWSDCQYCEENQIERHDDEYDDDPMYTTDYTPKPMPGIWQNYVRWFTKEPS